MTNSEIIQELKKRLKELQEKEPHATVTREAYEEVIYDLVGGMVGK